MLKKLFIGLIFIQLVSAFALQAVSIRITHTKKTKSGIALLLAVDLKKGESILKESLRFSTDCPNLTTDAWQTKQEAVSHYISGIKKNKKLYDESCTIALKLSKTDTKKPIPDNAHLHISCFVHSNQKINPHLMMLPLKNRKAA